MADLNDGRGQIILVAAFALGVIFIALAVVVNAAIFTENLATRGEATSDSDALHYRHEVEESAGRALDFVNAEGTGSVSDFESNLTNISLQGTRQKARLGRVVTVEYVSGSENFGTRLENTSGTYIGNDSLVNWNVSSDAQQTRDFVLNVSGRDSLSEGSTGAFKLSVDNGTHFWNMTVYNSTSSSKNVIVEVKNTAGDVASCTRPVSDSFKIDVTGGSVAGESCHALTVSNGDVMWYPTDLTPDYNISFYNAGQIKGGYRATIDGTETDDFPEDTSESTPAIYSLDVRYTYQTPSLYYETDIRVAPGEPDI